ncbi:MAG: MBL fold metallo-hydrolase [Chloroflexi bacterium]|nr:MBL fold metallo-hydrolase [Chloroflexota bacterium]
MEVKITTLSENTVGVNTHNHGLIAEWGLSILVEADNKKILMDTGSSFSAVHNAQLLGIDLTTLDYIVLSHGHYDHTGGLREVLGRCGSVNIVAHPEIWVAKYVKRKDGSEYIGIPFSRNVLESLGAKFNLTNKPFHITDRIVTSGEIPAKCEYENMETNFFIKDGCFEPIDKFQDDLALIIDTDFGLVVVLGCGHRGVINTLHHAQKLTGNENIYAVIGGVHLFRASVERVEQTINDLKAVGVKKLGLSHCTGFYASMRLYQEFGDGFFLNNTGNSFVLP